MASDRCPTCHAPWSPQEAARAAERALQRLRDSMRAPTETTAAAAGTSQAAVDPAVPRRAAAAVPIDADREVWCG